MTNPERAAIRALVREHGFRRASQLLAISVNTVVRAVRGRGVQKATRLLLRIALARLAAPTEPTP